MSSSTSSSGVTPGGSRRQLVRYGDLEITYDDRVLSPRLWTTAQARWMTEVLHRLPEGPVAELCSGAGHIGLLTAAYTGRDVVLVDASDVACELAERNLEANPVSGEVEVRRGRIDEALAPHERFVGILADPPWVPSDRTPAFPDDPLTAIDGGPDGLDVARVCIDVIARHLAEPGAAILQLGSLTQAQSVVDDLATRAAETGLEWVDTRTYGERGVLVHLARTT
jgi:release factor glutamine methyltransferase